MISTRQANCEPIPGYRLLSPLGKGGFGEVWKCEAPGGLFKAIKFVSGNNNAEMHDSRCLSSEELRAIDRIKEVRHPFLLSMERVERCGEELVIVMELADRTLHDLLLEHPSGLPRDEVIGYLREAAEVLDLMNFEYGLQHLDIKPRNLFLVRDHVKVADFGLVQSLGETGRHDGAVRGEVIDMSMVTPLYAAPELFQSRISERCDQYSLAIVYQELLTGVRPFDGKNVRQLMMQHTVGTPNLDALPESDRAVVLKALSKEPAKRYVSCMDFVSALKQAGIDTTTPASGRTSRPRATPVVRSQVGRDTKSHQAITNTQSLGPVEGRALPDFQFLHCVSRDPRGETWEAKTEQGKPKFVHVLYGIGGAGGRHDPETILHLQTLRHPALLPMQLVASGPGSLLLVTDRLEKSLRQRYQEFQSKGEPGIPQSELLDKLEQTAEALDQLYQQQGLQHLELNPSRILLDNGKVLIDQLGVAQLLWIPSGVPCSQAQVRYTAPERAMGLVTRSCDQFSLAVIYHEMLTGKSPFRATMPRKANPKETLTHAKTLDLSNLPPAERAIVARALEADPERRFPSAGDFLRALRAAGASSVTRLDAVPLQQDPVRQERQEKLARLVEEAKHWMRLQQGEIEKEISAEVAAADVLQRRFVAIMPPGAALRKFDGFRRQWDAQVLEEGDGFAIFQVVEKSRSWLPWRGKPGSLRVEVRWSKVGTLTRKIPEVIARVQPSAATCKTSLALLPTMGSSLLESLQSTLMGNPERRAGERILWPHNLEVTCVTPGRSKGEVLECQGKDLSLTGLGLYMPRALSSSQVQVRLTSPITSESVVVPGSIVRIQRWDDQLFEVGIIFE